jgi:hypothetical protein
MTQKAKSPRRTIADCIRESMIADKRIIVWRGGDPDRLIEACMNASTTRNGNEHPLARMDRALAAIKASPLFRQAGYIRACDSRGAREILHPVFVLVERDATGENGSWGPKPPAS